MIMDKVGAGYRLSWSCMQLAYVSTGSFISPGGQIPVEAVVSQGQERRSWVDEGWAQLRQRCLKKRVFYFIFLFLFLFFFFSLE